MRETGKTPKELADALNVDESTISRWKAGRVVPESDEKLSEIATAFGLKSSYFDPMEIDKPVQKEPMVPESVAKTLAVDAALAVVERLKPKTFQAALDQIDSMFREFEIPDAQRYLVLYLASGIEHYLDDYKRARAALPPEMSAQLAHFVQAIQKLVLSP